MKILLATLMASSFSSGILSATPSLNSNILIDCMTTTGKNWLLPCEIDVGKIILDQPYAMDATFHYSYNGCTHTDSETYLKVGISSDAGTRIYFKYGQSGTVSASGRTFRIIDDTSNLENKRHNTSCTLMVTKVNLKASQHVIDGWRDTITRRNSQISDIESSIEGWQAAIDSFAFYDAVMDVTNSFHKELTNSDLLTVRRNSATIAAAIAGSLASSDCGLFSEEERSSLANSLAALFVLHDPTQWTNSEGSPKKFEDFFGIKDREILKEIAAKYDPSTKEGFQENIDNARLKIGELKKEISDTEVLLQIYAD